VNTLGEALDDLLLAMPHAYASRTPSSTTSSQSQSQSQSLHHKACSRRQFYKGSSAKLPSDVEYEADRLLKAIGNDADEGTPGVVRSLARQLPSFTLARVRESLALFDPRNKAAYAVGALKSEIEERRAA
jgi:hypothetical protein